MSDKSVTEPGQTPGSPEVKPLAHPRVRANNKMRYSRIVPLNIRTAPEETTHTSPQKSPIRMRSDHSQNQYDDFNFEDIGIGPNFGGSSTSTEPLERSDNTSPANASTASSTSNGTHTNVGSSVSPLKTHQRRTSSASERIIELRGSGKRSWFPPLNQLDSGSSLIMRRIQKNKERLSSNEAQKDTQLGLTELKQDFARRSYDGVNWEFWAHVVGDYDSLAKSQPEKLRKAIQQGFPHELRGLLWQVISSSKSSTMEHLYESLVQEENAPAMPAIAKDLDRTPMAKVVDRESLARLLKAYSLFDPEVGYTQGMAFIAVPILMELPEAEAFSLFAQLMKVYDFRSVFIAEMPGLHLKLYQFDRLVEDNLEIVHTHLKRQGVQSSMYASQWFLTMFAYRFPPELVTRIFDIVIAEGMEAILRFALALMEVGAKKILQLESIDTLLPFLKDQIFDGHEHELVRLASEVVLYPQVLSKYELEFIELNRLEKERMMQMDVLRENNARISLQNKQLEAALEALNKEHIQIANKMVTNGIDKMHLEDENMELRERAGALQIQINDLNAAKTELEEQLKSTKSQSNELARARREIEQYEKDVKFLRLAEDTNSKADLLKEVEELREVKKRYEAQLGSLQESLASALTDHH